MHTLYLCIRMLYIYKYIHILIYIHTFVRIHCYIYWKKKAGSSCRVLASVTGLLVLHTYMYAHILYMCIHAMHIKLYTYSRIHIYIYTYMNSSVYISDTTLWYRSICVVYIYVCTHLWVVYVCMHTFCRCECMLYISRYTYTHIYIYTYVKIDLYTNCKTKHWFILLSCILRYRSIYVYVSYICNTICTYSNAYLHLCVYSMYIKYVHAYQNTHLYICIYICIYSFIQVLKNAGSSSWVPPFAISLYLCMYAIHIHKSVHIKMHIYICICMLYI